MQFSNVALLLTLAVSSLAAPVCSPKATATAVAKAAPAPTAAKGSAGSVLTVQNYNNFQVSDGVAGNALAEVNAKFPIDLNNLAGVSASDLQIITKAAQVGEQAEVGKGGFNDAIAAAGGQNTPAGKALQVGKIKNKVLKLQTDVLRIMIEVAQGNKNSASSLAGQQAKLAKNVQLDVAAKGQKSTPVNFAGTD